MTAVEEPAAGADRQFIYPVEFEGVADVAWRDGFVERQVTVRRRAGDVGGRALVKGIGQRFRPRIAALHEQSLRKAPSQLRLERVVAGVGDVVHQEGTGR